MKHRARGLLLLGIPLLTIACGGSTASPAATSPPAFSASATATDAPAISARATVARTTTAGTRPASPASTATRAATPTMPTAPTSSPTATGIGSTAATVIAPGGTARAPGGTPSASGAIPAGWQIYGGTVRVPFTIAYPPDWTVDDSRANQGRVYIYGPGVTQPYEDALWILIGTTGQAEPDANIDVLRDQYFATEIKDPHPEAGIDVTRRNTFSGLTFASLGATFNSNGQLCYAYIGLAVRDQVPWRFRLNSPYADYTANLEGTFAPMIGSLNIYANP